MIKVSEIGSTTKVALHGRLDTAAVHQTEQSFFDALVPGERNAVIDLSGVTFIASLGLRMLLSTARALSRKGARFILFGAIPAVTEIIETTALSDILPVFATESEALAALTQ